MAASGRKKFANSNLNTLLGAPKESAKANYGPAVRSGGVVKPVAKPKGLVSLGKAPASSTVSARKGAAWNQLEEEAKKREEESAKKQDDSRPDWTLLDVQKEEEEEAEAFGPEESDIKELAASEPRLQGDRGPVSVPEDGAHIHPDPIRRDMRPPPPSVPPPHPVAAAPMPPATMAAVPSVQPVPVSVLSPPDAVPVHMAPEMSPSPPLQAQAENGDDAPEHAVLDVPRTALVVNISRLLKNWNGSCSLNELAKHLGSFKEKTKMSLEDFLRAESKTFRLEGSTVLLVEQRKAPPKESPVGGHEPGLASASIKASAPVPPVPRKAGGWSQDEEAKRRMVEEESARRQEELRPDWTFVDEDDEEEPPPDHVEVIGGDLVHEPEEVPPDAAISIRRDTRPPPPNVPPPHPARGSTSGPHVPHAPHAAPGHPPASIAPWAQRNQRVDLGYVHKEMQQSHFPQQPPIKVREVPTPKPPAVAPVAKMHQDEVAGNSSEESMDEEPPPEHAVLDLMVPRTALVINISHVLKRLNGCCSLNQLTKQMRSFKEKTGMSLEAFLRANPMTFKLEGRIVYLVDRDGEKWVPPSKQDNPVGHDSTGGSGDRGKGKGKEGKSRGTGGDGRNRGKAGSHKGDNRVANGESRNGKGAPRGKSHGEWRTGNSGQWSNDWDEWQDDWKASGWKGW